MKAKELIRQLKEFPEDTDVFVANPVAGDCENLADLTLYLDDRYPALVLFPKEVEE
jgi:hypothetical protein